MQCTRRQSAQEFALEIFLRKWGDVDRGRREKERAGPGIPKYSEKSKLANFLNLQGVLGGQGNWDNRYYQGQPKN